MDPTVEAETELTVDDLIPSDAAAVGAGTARSSRDRADRPVVQLERRGLDDDHDLDLDDDDINDHHHARAAARAGRRHRSAP
jgi:hypothetical protein